MYNSGGSNEPHEPAIIYTHTHIHLYIFFNFFYLTLLKQNFEHFDPKFF